MANSKSELALVMVLRNDCLAVDFTKLTRVSADLRSEIERNPLLARIMEAELAFDRVPSPKNYDPLVQLLSNPGREFYKMASEPLLDWAYEQRKFFFSVMEPPPKNANAYEVIGLSDYQRLTNPREYAEMNGITDEEAAPIYDEAERRKDEVRALKLVSEGYWKVLADFQNLSALRWLAKNFTLREDRPLEMMAVAIRRGDLREMEAIFETYRNKIDWLEAYEEAEGGENEPFAVSLEEDRIQVAEWLLETFAQLNPRMRDAWRPDYYYAFSPLFKLNNVAAVEWLLKQYPLNLEGVFGLDAQNHQVANYLWLMKKNGREELANYLSKKYGLQPAPTAGWRPTKDEVYLTIPPPSTMRLSQVSLDYKEKLRNAGGP